MTVPKVLKNYRKVIDKNKREKRQNTRSKIHTHLTQKYTGCYIQKVILVAIFFIASCGENNSGSPGSTQNAGKAGTESAASEKIAPNQVYSENLKVKTQNSKQQLQQFAKHLQLKYEVITNRPGDKCNKQVFDGVCFLASITLELDRPILLPTWRIFFSHMSPIQQDYSDAFNIVHVNGDLHYIEPTNHFSGWEVGQVEKIEFVASVWHISEFDSPPNFYVVAEGEKPVIIDSTKATIDPETQLEVLKHVNSFTKEEELFKRTNKDNSVWATASNLFRANQSIKQKTLDVSSRIIPKPKNVELSSGQNTLDISNGLKLLANPFSIDLDNSGVARLNRLGLLVAKNKGKPISLVKAQSKLGKEGYQLTITSNGIEISAEEEVGAFYGLQSLAALYTPGVSSLPLLKVIDEPRYEFRGLLLDVARNFRSREFIIKLLDQMAAYKLNRLHLHLGDDEGWRLEIPGLPELTKIGAKRCHNLSESHCLLPQLGSGPHVTNVNEFYSVDDYQKILKAAQARNIEVIPSFDMPGHSRAAVVSMLARYKKFRLQGNLELAEEYLLTDLNDQSDYSSIQYYTDNTLNVCRESTYRFVEKVIDEVVKIHNLVEVPLETYHIGADETPGAWKDSPECKLFMQEHNLKHEELGSHFIKEISHFLKSKNIHVAGWSDGLAEVKANEMPSDVQVNVWRPLFWDGHKVAHDMANQDWDVIISIPDVLYFDFPYEADPKERGYYWGARYTNTRQLFEFMPDNLPLHAEIWTDRENNPMILDDRPGVEQKPPSDYKPLLSGKKYRGIQGHLWSEMVRTDDIAEYMLFPRLLALAERAWHKPAWEPKYRQQGAIYSQKSEYFSDISKKAREQDWREFANTVVQKEMIKLDKDGWLYRLPTVGGIYQKGVLKLNSAFPGLQLEFKVDDGAWQEYQPEDDGVRLAEARYIKIRAKSPGSERYGRTLIIENSSVK